MKYEKVFIKTETVNFWWGEYGLLKVSDEFISIYKDEKCKKLLGRFDIYAKPIIEEILSESELDTDINYIKKIKSFLAGNEVVYDYIYPRDFKDVLFHQVKHKAPRNEYGKKPTYIIMWNHAEYLNVEEIKKCIKLFLMNVYQAEVENIEFVDAPTYEEALKSYKDEARN